MPDGVLPPLGLELPVVGERLPDVLVDLRQLQFSLLAILDGHGDHSHVTVRRLDIRIGYERDTISVNRCKYLIYIDNEKAYRCLFRSECLR